MSIQRKSDPKFLRTYDRAMFRSAARSLFWGIFAERRKETGITFESLAKAAGSTKHEVSRWFNGDPNWTLNTMANIANALNVDLKLEAIDRATGKAFTASGVTALRHLHWETSNPVDDNARKAQPVAGGQIIRNNAAKSIHRIAVGG
jgi:transcriptional regulator with XRE-family HTH domain